MECAVLFSGGSDSTLVAALAAEKFSKVHLLTMNRKGFFGAEVNTLVNYERLTKIFGSRRFERVVINVEPIHRRMLKSLTVKDRFRIGPIWIALTFCKIPLHVAALQYCKKHKIYTVMDGATSYMNLYPDQNRRVGQRIYQSEYKKSGIDYISPLQSSLSAKVEESLFVRGITDRPSIRGTKLDKQVFYLEQVVFAFLVRFSIRRYGYRQYISKLESLYREFVPKTVNAEN